MLNNQKKLGIALVLTASALLVAAFLAVPFGATSAVRTVLAIIGAVLLLCAAPIMWKDGIKRIKDEPRRKGSLLTMRQSGFFDFIVLLLIVATVLAAMGVFGLITYNSTLSKHIALAGSNVKTLEEARLVPEFIEYNFKKDLNFVAASYGSFLLIATIIFVACVVSLVYMRFVSPIVRADESLQRAHKIYRTTAH